MTDDTTKTPAAADRNGSDAGSPFGGLAIDFSGDTGAVPLAAAVAPDRVRAGGRPSHRRPTAAARPRRARAGPSRSVIIVGSGPAGLTAAIYAARANLEPIVLAGSAPGGQLMLTSDVENYPGFPEGIQGPDLMARFRAQAERFGTHIVDVDVERVDFSERPFRLWARGVEYRGQSVIVATGASAIWLGLESETRLRGRGVCACATCDGFFFRDKEIAVVGGGDTALEEATLPDPLRDAGPPAPPARRVPGQQDHGRPGRGSTPRSRSTRTPPSTRSSATTRSRRSACATPSPGPRRTMPAEGLFVAIGHKPNTEVFRDWLEVDEKGYLVVHDQTETKIEGVFVAGDVHDHRYRQAVTAAGDGCRAAIDAERWLEHQGITEASTADRLVSGPTING